MADSHPYALIGTKQRYGYRKHKRLMTGVLVGLCVLYLGLMFFWDAGEAEDAVHRVQGLSSTVEGHAGGYKVLKNVGFHDRTFYFFNSTQPDERSIMSGTNTEVCTNGTFYPNVYYPGTTLLLNEGATPDWSGLYHYYHFAVENLLGGLAALGSVHDGAGVPDRLVMPWDQNWHDKWTMNEMIVGAMFEEVVDAHAWESIRQGNAFFEEVIFVDRQAAHHTDPEVELWLKMPIVVFQNMVDKQRSDFFDTARERVYDKLDAPRPTGERIAYIDRQRTDRKLPQGEHEAFVAEMEELVKEHEGVAFDHLILEDMTPQDQIRRISQATILVGVHGNGLTHLLWLPPKSAVIELFMPNAFFRDYQCSAEVLGHSYTAICNDTIYTKAEWEAHPGAFGGDLLHNGTPVDVDVPLLVRTVRGVLERRLGL